MSRALLVGAVAVGVALPLALAALTGNLSIPHNDAWAYSRIAQTYGETGRIELLGWNRSVLVGQFLPLGPIASNLVAQQVFVALLALLALVAVYDLASRHAGRLAGAGITLLCALWPGFGLLATSFMTDVPAFAAVALCLAIGDRGVRVGSTWLIVAATLVGTWGVSIRVQAVAAPVAVLVVAWHEARPGHRPGRVVVAALGATTLLATWAVTRWFSHLPGSDPLLLSSPMSNLGATASFLLRGAFVVGLVAAPCAPLLVARTATGQHRRRALVSSGLALAIAGGSALALGPDRYFLPNYLAASGPYAEVLPSGRQVFPTGVWLVLVAVSAAGLTALVGALAARRPRITTPSVFAVLTVGGTAGLVLVGQPGLDRYWLPALPAILLVALDATRPDEAVADVDARRPSRSSAVAAVGALVVLVTLAGAITANGLAFDRARWSFATLLVDDGTDPERVDAGLEWLGTHSDHGVVHRYAPVDDGWAAAFSDVDPCVVLRASPFPDGRSAHSTFAYRTFVLWGDDQLYAYALPDSPGCEAP